MFVYQLKNTRAALLDAVLKPSHLRRLICPRALGKMQRKPSKLQKFTGNTLIRRSLFEIEDETAVRNSRSK